MATYLVASLPACLAVLLLVACGEEPAQAPPGADAAADLPGDAGSDDAPEPSPDSTAADQSAEEPDQADTGHPDADQTEVDAVDWTECGEPPTGLVAELGPDFDALLGTLWADYWSPDGNWDGDMMGDATAFAPELLFPLAERSGCLELRERARATVEYEVELVYEYMRSGANEMETVVGAPALITGYEWTGDPSYKLMAAAGLQLLANQTLGDPEALSFFFTPPVALGSMAYYIFRYAQVSGDDTLVDEALAAIELADDRYWDEDNGYYGDLFDWSEAMMLMALASAYEYTGEAAYLERAQRLATTVLDLMWNEDRGGFWATHRDDRLGAGLSGQAFMTRAFLMLYRVSCEETYLTTARETLEYSFGSDLYVDGLIRHDWTPLEGTATEACTGCNFFTLSNLWMYERLAAESCSPEGS